MHTIVPFAAEHLDQLAWLVNVHTSSVVPGWAVTPAVLAARLEREPGEFVVDPWVVERRTLVALERDRVVAAAHLLRYGVDERVGPAYRAHSEIRWLLFWPDARDAATSLLEAGLRQLDAWHVERYDSFDGGLDTGTSGIPDTWPHIAALARDAGFTPLPERTEYLHVGWIPEGDPPSRPPVPELTLRRSAVDNATRFAALVHDEQVGIFDVDTIDGMHTAAQRGWASPWNFWVEPDHRSQGIGTWLVRSACAWLRLAGTTRMVVSVDVEGHRDGASRFYERLGWHQVATFERAWSRPLNDADRSARSSACQLVCSVPA